MHLPLHDKKYSEFGIATWYRNGHNHEFEYIIKLWVWSWIIIISYGWKCWENYSWNSDLTKFGASLIATADLPLQYKGESAHLQANTSKSIWDKLNNKEHAWSNKNMSLAKTIIFSFKVKLLSTGYGDKKQKSSWILRKCLFYPVALSDVQ